MIDEDPNNIWKIFNRVVKGKENRDITLKEGEVIIDNNEQISNIMNTFFREKIETIKNNLEKLDN